MEEKTDTADQATPETDAGDDAGTHGTRDHCAHAENSSASADPQPTYIEACIEDFVNALEMLGDSCLEAHPHINDIIDTFDGIVDRMEEYHAKRHKFALELLTSQGEVISRLLENKVPVDMVRELIFGNPEKDHGSKLVDKVYDALPQIAQMLYEKLAAAAPLPPIDMGSVCDKPVGKVIAVDLGGRIESVYCGPTDIIGDVVIYTMALSHAPRELWANARLQSQQLDVLEDCISVMAITDEMMPLLLMVNENEPDAEAAASDIPDDDGAAS